MGDHIGLGRPNGCGEFETQNAQLDDAFEFRHFAGVRAMDGVPFQVGESAAKAVYPFLSGAEHSSPS